MKSKITFRQSVAVISSLFLLCMWGPAHAQLHTRSLSAGYTGKVRSSGGGTAGTMDSLNYYSPYSHGFVTVDLSAIPTGSTLASAKLTLTNKSNANYNYIYVYAADSVVNSSAQFTSTVYSNLVTGNYSYQYISTPSGSMDIILDPALVQKGLTHAGKKITLGIYIVNYYSYDSYYGYTDSLPYRPKLTVSYDSTSSVASDSCISPRFFSLGNCSNPVYGTSVGAHPSGVSFSCYSYAGTYYNDRWYSTVVPASGSLYANLYNISNNYSLYYGIYKGHCGTLTQLNCNSVSPNDSFHLAATNLNPGDTILIRVLGQAGYGASYKLCATGFTAAKNDMVCQATKLTIGATCTSPVTDSLNFATNTGSANACGYDYGDLWYKIIVPSSGRFMVQLSSMSSSLYYVSLNVYKGTCSGLTNVSCNYYYYYNANKIKLSGYTPGDTVYLRVMANGYNPIGKYTICAFNLPTPANDECSNPKFLTLGNGSCSAPINDTIDNATQSGNSTYNCGTAGGDLWYAFVVPTGGNVIVQANINNNLNNFGSAYYSMFFHKCSGHDTLCTYVTTGSTTNGKLTMGGLHAGDTVLIRFYTSYTDARGDYNICAYKFTPVSNDKILGALPISLGSGTCGTTVSGTTLLSTESKAGKYTSSCTSINNHDVWYYMIAPSSGALKLTASTTDYSFYSGYVSVFSGHSNSLPLSEMGCSSFSYYSPQTVTVSGANAGDTLWVRVMDAYSGSTNDGGFTLCAYSYTPISYDNCSGASMLTVDSGSCITNAQFTIKNAAASNVSSYCIGTSVLSYVDVWFKFIVPANGNPINIKGSTTDNSHFYSGYFAVYKGQCGSLTEVNPACNSFSYYTATTTLYSGLNPGDTLFVRVLHSGVDSGNFNLCVWQIADTIPNDIAKKAKGLVLDSGSCSGTHTLTGNTTNAYPTTGLTSCYSYYNQNDLWYYLVVPSTGGYKVQVSNGASSGITYAQVSLYNGSVKNLNLLGCQYAYVSSTPITIGGAGTPGDTIRIRVMGMYNYNGTFNICAYRLATAANNICSHAVTVPVDSLACSSSTSVSFTNSLPVLGSTLPSCANNSSVGEIWYKIHVPAGKTNISITLNPGSSSYYSVYAVYKGTCSSMTEMGCTGTYYYTPSSIVLTGLTPGDMLYVRCFDYYNYQASGGNICAYWFNNPSNDNCSGATLLTANKNTCTSITDNTVYATASGIGQSTCGSGAEKADLWYKIPIDSSTHLKVNMVPGYNMYNGSLDLYKGHCGSLTHLGCTSTAYYNSIYQNSIYVNNLSIGDTVFARAMGQNANGSFTICAEWLTPPSNDDCANATLVHVDSAYCHTATNGTTVNATPSTQVAPSCATSYNGADVWYKFIVPPSGHTVITLNNTSALYYINLSLYKGHCGSMTELNCQNIYNAYPYTLTQVLTPGDTIYMRVSGFSGYDGTFNICVYELNQPGNDHVCQAKSLPVGAAGACNYTNGTTAFSDLTSGLTYGACTPYNDVWYKSVVPASGNLNITATCGSTNGSILNGTINIYKGTCSSLTYKTCFNFGTGTSNTLLTCYSPGDTVFIRVSGQSASYNGTFSICASDVTPTAKANAYNHSLGCSGSSTTMYGTTTNTSGAATVTYSWSPSTGLSATNTQYVTASPTVSTTYTLTVLVNGCTTLHDTIGISFTPTTIAHPNDTTICYGQSTKLNYPSVYPAYYSLSPGGTTSYSTFTVTPTTSTTYVVTLNAGVCTKNDTVVVTVTPDNTAPVINCPATATIYVNSGTCTATGFYIGTATATDNCTPTSSIVITNNASSSYTPGDYTVTWKATDLANNVDSCHQTIHVVDNQAPSITCPSGITQSITDTSTCTASVSLGTPITSDNCGVSTVTNNAPSTFSVGSTSVKWTVTDIHSNSNYCYQNVTINNLPTPTISYTGSTSFCQGDSLVLTSNYNTGNQWYYYGSAISGATGKTLVVKTSGYYTVQSKCTNTSTGVSVSVTALTVGSITYSGSTTLCQGQSLTLNTSNGYAKQWYYNGSPITGATGYSYNASAAGVYKLQTTNGSCTRMSTDSVVISVNPAPTAEAGPDKSILLGSSVTLTGTGGPKYSWNDGDTTASTTVAPTTTTSYILTVTNSHNCTATDTAVVTVNFSSVTVGPNILNFGSVVKDSISTMDVVVKNNGTLPDTVKTITSSDAAYTFSSKGTPRKLNAGDTMVIHVHFKPTATIFYNAKTLTIGISLGNQVVTMNGYGSNPAPGWSIAPASHAFGYVSTSGKDSATFTITNTGNIPISVGTIVSSSGVFTGSVSLSTIPVAGSATLKVKFAPASIIAYSGTITINSNTASTPSLLVSLSGHGYIVNPPPVLTFSKVSPYNNTTGVSPTVGLVSNVYTYKVIYKSSTNTPPQAGYPKIGIDLNGNHSFSDAGEGVYSMTDPNPSNHNYSAGKEYDYNYTFSSLSNGNFGFQFFAYDSLGNVALDSTVGYYTAPVVTSQTLDLSILAIDINFSNNHPGKDSVFTVSATIHNNTAFTASNFNVRFDRDSIYIKDTNVSFIGAYSTVTIYTKMKFGVAGFYPIKVIIDSADALHETNRLNNYAIRPVIVGAYTVAGSIQGVVTSSPDSICPNGGIYYTATATYQGGVSTGTKVLGAQVAIKVSTGDSIIGYIDANGNYAYYYDYLALHGVPLAPGKYYSRIYITDFTLNYVSGKDSFVVKNCTSGYYGLSVNTSVPQCNLLGDSSVFTTYIHNYGTITSLHDSIKIYEDGNLIYKTYVDSIPSGHSLSYSQHVLNSVLGTHTYSAYVYPTNYSVSSSASVLLVTPKITNLQAYSFYYTPYIWKVNVPGTITMNIYNNTCYASDTTHVLLYDSSYTTGVKVLVGSYPLAVLQGLSGAAKYQVRTFTQTGYHLLCFTVDAGHTMTELTYNDNKLCMLIYVEKPDLVCTGLIPSSHTPKRGDLINFQETIYNNGSDADSFAVAFYADGAPFGTIQKFAGLAAGASMTIYSDPWKYTDSCPHNIAVMVDTFNQVDEESETNNRCRLPYGVDILVSYFGANYTYVLVGQPATIPGPTYNNGQVYADTTTVQFRLGDTTLIGWNRIALLHGGFAQIQHTFNTVGVYPVYCKAGYDTSGHKEYCEETYANNQDIFYVYVVSALPDLQVRSYDISPQYLNPLPGQTITIVGNVHNVGGLKSKPTNIRFDMDGNQLGALIPIGVIQPGGDTTVEASVTWSSTVVGPHIITEWVDSAQDMFEVTYLNNKATRAVIIGSAPDLTFTPHHPITIDKLHPQLCDTVNLCAYIRNIGGDSGRAWVHFYKKIYGSTTYTYLDSQFVNLAAHDSMQLCFKWGNVDTNDLIKVIIGKVTPQEFNTLNNDDSATFHFVPCTRYTVRIPSLSGCLGSSGHIIADVIGGHKPYTFYWYKDSSYYKTTMTDTLKFTNLAYSDTGKYSCTVVDSLSDTSRSLIVKVRIIPPLHVVAISANDTICNGDSTLLSATGATHYMWSTGSSKDSIYVHPTVTTTYTVTGNNTTYLTADYYPTCPGTDTVVVHVKNCNPFNVYLTNISKCLGTKVNMLAFVSGGHKPFTYHWYKNNTSYATTSTDTLMFASLSYSDTGRYSCTVVDSLSDTARSFTVKLKVIPPLNVVAIANPYTICKGGSSLLTVSGATHYSWSTVSTSDSVSVSPTVTTTYTVTGHNSGDLAVVGCPASDTVVVTVKNCLIVTGPYTQTKCVGDSVQMTVYATGVTGPFVYHWYKNGSYYTSTSTSTLTKHNIVLSDSGMYFCTVIDSMGDSATSTTATLHVNAPPVITATASPSSICNGDSSLLIAGGSTVYMWNTGSTRDSIYVHPTTTTTYTVKGAASTVALMYPGAYGCPGTGTVVVKVNSSSSSTVSASICAGQSYSFNGSTYTTAGTYMAHVTNSAGCDSAITLNLTVKNTSSSSVSASICSGQSYSFNGSSYTTAGAYTAHLTNSVGCDSAVTLNLTVKNTSSSSVSASICSGQSYSFNGSTYTTTGTYTAHLTNSVGCDSAVTLNLTVKNTSSSSVSASICSGHSYSFNGSTYTTAGTYTAHLTNSVGCDSAITLTLTVKNTSSSTINAAICSGQSYSFNGSTYTTSGTYTATLTNKAGCDSVVTLVLTVKSSYSSSINATICSGSSYTFNRTVYTSTGSYTAHYTNKAGCDSAVTLNLTVNAKATPTITIAANPGTNFVMGTHVTFTATTSNGGSTPSYQWKKNGSSVGTNSSTYSDSTLLNGDTITCTLTSNATCITSSTVNSNKLGISIITSCGPITLTMSAGTGGTLIFHWTARTGSYKLYYTSMQSLNSYSVVTTSYNGYTIMTPNAGTTYIAYVVDQGCTNTMSNYAYYNVSGGTCTTTAPSALSATPTITTAALSWTGSASNYQVYYQKVGASGWASTSTSTASYSLSSLSASTCYAFFVVNKCGSTLGYSSRIDTFCTAANCSAPTTLTLSAVTCHGFTASWGAVSGVSSYELYVTRTTGAGSPSTNALRASSTSYVFSTGSTGTGYSAYVKSWCNSITLSATSSNTATTTTLSLGCKDEDNNGNSIATQQSASGLFNIYPNPNNGVFSVVLSSTDVTSPVTINVTDVTGRTIYVATLENSSGTIKYDIDLDGKVADGVYNVDVIQGNSRYNRRVVITGK